MHSTTDRTMSLVQHIKAGRSIDISDVPVGTEALRCAVPDPVSQIGAFRPQSKKQERAKKSNGWKSECQSKPTLLEEHDAEEGQRTKSWLTGHTPLPHDFVNCSVLTAQVK
mmetsp:Transcript_14288/g.40655  ORF Transcript_14288/g.40655 Transcript_14288/m.40655 type:complete len:111 (+) Transcript_14288:170-502(+)